MTRRKFIALPGRLTRHSRGRLRHTGRLPARSSCKLRRKCGSTRPHVCQSPKERPSRVRQGDFDDEPIGHWTVAVD
jgi:hypothetical protein